MDILSKIQSKLPWLLVLLSSWSLFYGIIEMPMDIDEISAYLRAENKSFSNLFLEGILPDAHPMLTQLFLFLTIKISGGETIIIHLVAATAGALSLFLFFGFIQMFFNKMQAAFLTFFLGSSEIYAHYLHLFRPYVWSMVMLFLMLFALKKWKETKFQNNRWWGLYIFALWGSASTHYFACVAAIIFLAFIFIREQKIRKKLMAGAVWAFVFYLPQMYVFYHQIQHGGLAWIGKPNIDFVLMNLWNSLNFSIPILFVLLLVIIFILIKKIKIKWHSWLKYGTYAYLLLFILAFVYSWTIGPILQHSTLMFLLFFPLLMIGVVVFSLPKKLGYSVMIIIVALQVWELSVHRRHFYITNNQITTVLLKSIQKNNIFGVLIDNPKRTEFIKRSIEIDDDRLLEVKEWNLTDFYAKMKRLSEEETHVNLALIEAAPREYLTIALQFFPEILARKDGLQGTFWSLKKDSKAQVWKDIKMDLNTQEEYFNIELPSMNDKGSYHYAFETNVESHLVIQNQEKNIYKSSRIIIDNENKKFFLGLMMPLDIPSPNLKLNTYFFNPNKKKYRIENIKFRFVEDNNYLYSRGRYLPYEDTF